MALTGWLGAPQILGPANNGRKSIVRTKHVAFLALILLLLWVSACTESEAMNTCFIGGGVPVAAGESEEACTGACFWVSSWSGSDVINTGSGYVWDSESDNSTILDRSTASGEGFAGDEDNHLLTLGTTDAYSYILEDFTNIDDIGVRFAIYIDSISVSTFNHYVVLNDAAASGSIYFFVGHDGSNHYLKAQILDTGDSLQDVGSQITVSLDTWYQVRLIREKNVQGDDAGAGASFEVYNEAGQVGTTQVLSSSYTVKNNQVSDVRMGGSSNPWNIVDLRGDRLILTNTYVFPALASW